MRVLEHLHPQTVFYYFEELCSIPHGSGNTKAISDYCVAFAGEHQLPCKQDAMGNVIIKKSATPGYETHAPVMLQGHLDMVCEKNEAISQINMDTEGLRLGIDGDDIHANGTTLGGDDGIAVAYCLALLAADNLAHPPLEVVLTVDEEIGLLGAAGLDMSSLDSRIMINLDSELEGIYLTSCAGGVSTICELPVMREAYKGNLIELTVDGLLGGHSGVEIDKGRGNANKLMARFLYALYQEVPFALVDIHGGLKDNAIPLSAQSVIITQDAVKVKALADRYCAAFRNEFKTSDPDVSLTAKVGEIVPEKAMTPADTDRILTFLVTAPNGIQTMSADIPGLVESSLNLGILRSEQNKLIADFSVRSSVKTLKEEINQRLYALVSTLGGTLNLQGDYPAWEFKKDSHLREVMLNTYTELFGLTPKVEAIHAGLECGMFSGKLEGMDCISLGPNIKDIHTAKERLSISSTARIWKLLLETLKRL